MSPLIQGRIISILCLKLVIMFTMEVGLTLIAQVHTQFV